MRDKFLLFSACCLTLFSCKENKAKIAPYGTPNDCNVIAELKVTENGDTVTICDLEKVSSSFLVKISDLVDSLEIVKLDATQDDNFVKTGKVFLSDHYIGLKSEDQYKLFDRKGNFVRDIGRKGGGPGEYIGYIYDSQIDEKNDRIYIIEMGDVTKILTYDLKGQFIQDIPLVYKIHKGCINVDTESERVTVTSMPWKGSETPLVWTQNFKGSLLSEAWRNQTAVFPEFSSEVYSGMPKYGLDYAVFVVSIESRSDTLYHYNTEKGSISPKFAVKYPDSDKIPLHTYYELPNYYIAELYEKVFEGMDMTASPRTRVIIDKKTLKGGNFDLILDPLGGLLHKGYIAESRDGHFILNIDPGDLKNLIDESTHLLRDYLSSGDIQKLKNLNSSISADENNYLILGKWK